MQIFLYRSPRASMLVESATVALGAYSAAVIGAQVAQVWEDGDPLRIGAHAVFVVLVSASLLLFFRWLRSGPDRRRADMLATAHSQVDASVARQAVLLSQDLGTRERTLVPASPLDAIRDLVNGLYRCVDSHYGRGDAPGERVNFEATFMSRDFEDDQITVMAWANREGREPKSLTQRPRNPAIYDTTVTAELYREAAIRQVHARIVSDSSSDQNYSELYPGQKQRIRSSIVYPVLAPDNTLMGTLVVHCDEPGFFKEVDRKFWIDLLEVFGSRVALHKARLDWLQAAANVQPGGSAATADAPTARTPSAEAGNRSDPKPAG